MELWHIWIVVGFIMLILEIFTAGFVVASFGVACFIAAVVSYFRYSLVVQLITFSITTLVIIFTIRPFFMKIFRRLDSSQATGIAALVGKKATVTEMIKNSENLGRIKISGQDWKARSINDNTIEKGANVVILKIEGVTAIVERAQPDEKNE